ncbi:MAG: ABC transporter substrate-binding protein [Dehalococcoidia bacterium]|nr:ABC transporter substrate-binding protein [Dehalococcoidia bacterium]
MRTISKSRWSGLLSVALVLALLVTACAPAATPTPAPTTAPPAVTPTAAPKVEATKPVEKPVEKPATTPTTAAPAKATGAPIKVGFITPLSGPQAYLGVMSKIAVDLAVEDTNASGGINGSPVELFVEDSPFDPKQAVTAVRKLAEQEKVFAIIGPFATAEYEVAAPLAVDLKILVVGPTSMIPDLSAKNRPWAFGMNIPHEISAPRYIADFKKVYPNIKRVVLVGDTKERVTEYATKNVLPKVIADSGLQLLDTITFDTGIADFSAIVTKIKGLNPDGIVLSSLLGAALGLAKELQRQQVTVPVVTNTNPLSGSIIELGAAAVEGWVQPTLFDLENPDPKVQSFVKRVFERAEADAKVKPKPRIIVVEALYYDTAMMVFDSMRKGGVKADTALQDARQKTIDNMNGKKDYPGISGLWSIGPDGHGIRQAGPSIVLQKGQYKFIR